MKIILFILLLLSLPETGYCQKLPKNFGKLEAKLFSSDSSRKKLIVAFGGSEGGNTFAAAHTEDVRNNFLKRGFHFLSIAYFGKKRLPKKLDRISLNAVYDTVMQTGERLHIPASEIILLGASRGGELVLNLASHFDFKGVIALVPSNLTVPYLEHKKPVSSWLLHQKPLEFADIDKSAVNEKGWAEALENYSDSQKESNTGFIPIENIKGFILLTSGKNDKTWPSYKMCNAMIERLKDKDFKFLFSHLAFDGGHASFSHWPGIFAFLDEQVE